MLRRYALPLITLLVYLFLYVPIVVMITFSFNKSSIPTHWVGFTTQWYEEMIFSVDIISALKTSLIVAGSSVVLSVFMGLCAILYGVRTFVERLLVLFYATLATPDIVIAVGLVSFFAFVSIPLGIVTLIAGHTLLGLGYVMPILQTRFAELDKRYTEASMDLGATYTQTCWHIVLPLMMPAIIAASLIVFVISLDDFLISFFVAGPHAQTLPLYIFATIRAGATPTINALSTVLLGASSLIVLIFALLQVRKKIEVV